jgi:hypothetical protein
MLELYLITRTPTRTPYGTSQTVCVLITISKGDVMISIITVAYKEQTRQPASSNLVWFATKDALAGRETLYGNFIESDRGNLKE